LVWHRDHQVGHEHGSEPTVGETWRGFFLSEIQTRKTSATQTQIANKRQKTKRIKSLISIDFWEKWLVIARAVQLEIL
jgi:hypothetical protein